MRTVVLFLVATLASAVAPTVWVEKEYIDSGLKVAVVMQSFESDHNAYLVTFSWERRLQRETVTRVVYRNSVPGLPYYWATARTTFLVPAPDGDSGPDSGQPVTIHQIQVVPIKTFDADVAEVK